MKMIGLTIAVNRMDAMVAFYNAVFAAQLQPTAQIGEQRFYGGNIGELELTLCPNAIAGVLAQQNRQQFRFVVEDIAAVMKIGCAHHGSEINPIEENQGAKVAALADPDGNTIEFAQLPS